MENITMDKIAKKIIASAFKVSNTLGIGFVKKVNENAHLHPTPNWKAAQP
jgi:hypothetical protein